MRVYRILYTRSEYCVLYPVEEGECDTQEAITSKPEDYTRKRWYILIFDRL